MNSADIQSRGSVDCKNIMTISINLNCFFLYDHLSCGIFFKVIVFRYGLNVWRYRYSLCLFLLVIIFCLVIEATVFGINIKYLSMSLFFLSCLLKTFSLTPYFSCQDRILCHDFLCRCTQSANIFSSRVLRGVDFGLLKGGTAVSLYT